MIYSTFDRWQHGEGFSVDPSWYEWYRENVRCTNCMFPRRQWQEQPDPLNPTLTGSFEGTCSATIECPAAYYNSSLMSVLAEHIPDAVWGECHLSERSTMRPIRFHTLQVPRAVQAYGFRGAKSYEDQPDAGHHACPGCGRIQGFGGISEAFVERDTQDRPVVVDSSGGVYIRKEFAVELRLRERFEDLRFYMIPVLKEPADGWTLPNDPGWDGTLRPPPGFGQVPEFPCCRPGQRPR